MPLYAVPRNIVSRNGGGRLGGIFVSYRTADQSYAAAGIYRELCSRFGAARVFRDQNSMPPGTIYPEAIRRALLRCDVLVAVIGPHWLTAADSAGVRLLDDPRDWVRMEVEMALRLGITVMPVLLDGADPPAAADLPAEIGALAHAQAARVRHGHLEADIAALANAIAAALPRRRRLSVLARSLAALAAVAALALGWAGVSYARRPGANPAASGTAPALPGPLGRIVNPTDGGTVPRCTTIRGTASPAPAGSAYWLILTTSDGDLYVLGPQLIVHPSGNWEMRNVTIGGPATPAGYHYPLMLVRATSTASATWPHAYRSSNGDLARDVLPGGVEVVQHITVDRRGDVACDTSAYSV